MIENLTELLFLNEYYMYVLYFIFFFLQNNVRLFSTRLNIAVKEILELYKNLINQQLDFMNIEIKIVIFVRIA